MKNTPLVLTLALLVASPLFAQDATVKAEAAKAEEKAAEKTEPAKKAPQVEEVKDEDKAPQPAPVVRTDSGK